MILMPKQCRRLAGVENWALDVTWKLRLYHPETRRMRQQYARKIRSCRCSGKQITWCDIKAEVIPFALVKSESYKLNCNLNDNRLEQLFELEMNVNLGSENQNGTDQCFLRMPVLKWNRFRVSRPRLWLGFSVSSSARKASGVVKSLDYIRAHSGKTHWFLIPKAQAVARFAYHCIIAS